jgi:ATP-dependent Lon protease
MSCIANLNYQPTIQSKNMNELDQKLTSIFDGKVLRKDLLHRIKK